MSNLLTDAFCPTQDTADYVKPVTFSVDYELEHPENGPMLDDGWPTSLKVSVGSSTDLPEYLLSGTWAADLSLEVMFASLAWGCTS